MRNTTTRFLYFTTSLSRGMSRDICDCCRQLELSSDNVAMPLRMIEIYTDTKTYVGASTDVVCAIVLHLVSNGPCLHVALLVFFSYVCRQP